MEEAKRKEIETRLRRLLGNAAHEDSEKNEARGLRLSGRIQVIRRRKGCPDRHLATVGDPAPATPVA